MADIHPTAVVDPGARIADDVEIGPLCCVGADVEIGAGSRLLSQVTVMGHTAIGKGNTLWPHATLGGAPQDLKYSGEPTRLVIGDHNQIREFVTIHRCTGHEEEATRIGDHNMLMAYAHIAHDCVVGSHVIMANVALAGHIHIDDYVVIGGGTCVHHYVTIGQYAYLGGMTRVVHDVPPYMVMEGQPARIRGVNQIGLVRNGFESETVEHLKDAYRGLFKVADTTGVGRTAQALADLSVRYPDDPHVQHLLQAMRNSEAGVHGRYRESMRPDDRRSLRPDAAMRSGGSASK
ncbi:MAG: acyl-[acyl-carrier-protein]--UDP-N-acetylglucosamine O-acyltransferase [Phycisphaeraceae bacterium]|nr:acyl-[acyl-carrier-protein]--UDP-N-acetylglucosamine O-acyltransferase [Phycisphaeraceae bacterium]